VQYADNLTQQCLETFCYDLFEESIFDQLFEEGKGIGYLIYGKCGLPG